MSIEDGYVSENEWLLCYFELIQMASTWFLTNFIVLWQTDIIVLGHAWFCFYVAFTYQYAVSFVFYLLFSELPSCIWIRLDRCGCQWAFRSQGKSACMLLEMCFRNSIHTVSYLNEKNMNSHKIMPMPSIGPITVAHTIKPLSIAKFQLMNSIHLSSLPSKSSLVVLFSSMNMAGRFLWGVFSDFFPNR